MSISTYPILKSAMGSGPTSAKVAGPPRFPHSRINQPEYEQDEELQKLILAAERRRGQLFLLSFNYVHIGDWFVMPGEMADRIRKWRIEKHKQYLEQMKLLQAQAAQDQVKNAQSSLSDLLANLFSNDKLNQIRDEQNSWILSNITRTAGSTNTFPIGTTTNPNGIWQTHTTTTTSPQYNIQNQAVTVYPGGLHSGTPFDIHVEPFPDCGFFYHLGEDHLVAASEENWRCMHCGEEISENLREAARFLPTPQ